MTIVLDAGALIAVERGQQRTTKILAGAAAEGRELVTHAGVVGQVWRGGGRQARLAMQLESVEVVPLDEELARHAGVLLGRAGTSDVIDAAVVLLAQDDDDWILTSDPDDLVPLAEALGVHIELIPV